MKTIAYISPVFTYKHCVAHPVQPAKNWPMKESAFAVIQSVNWGPASLGLFPRRYWITTAKAHSAAVGCSARKTPSGRSFHKCSMLMVDVRKLFERCKLLPLPNQALRHQHLLRRTARLAANWKPIHSRKYCCTPVRPCSIAAREIDGKIAELWWWMGRA